MSHFLYITMSQIMDIGLNIDRKLKNVWYLSLINLMGNLVVYNI